MPDTEEAWIVGTWWDGVLPSSARPLKVPLAHLHLLPQHNLALADPRNQRSMAEAPTELSLDPSRVTFSLVLSLQKENLGSTRVSLWGNRIA